VLHFSCHFDAFPVDKTQLGTVFEMKVEVLPYLGAHNSIGKDQITLGISYGDSKVLGYKHMEDYEVPPWLQSR